jgi:hypothetical protein
MILLIINHILLKQNQKKFITEVKSSNFIQEIFKPMTFEEKEKLHKNGTNESELNINLKDLNVDSKKFTDNKEDKHE